MAGPSLDLRPPFGSVAEFVTWLQTSNPLKYGWNGVESSSAPASDGKRLAFKPSTTKESSRSRGPRPMFSTKVKDHVSFSERQRLRKKGLPLAERNGSHFDSPALSISSFADRQKLRRKGELEQELFDSVDHLFPGAAPEDDSSASGVSDSSFWNSDGAVTKCSDHFDDLRSLGSEKRRSLQGFIPGGDEKLDRSDDYDSSTDNESDIAGQTKFRLKLRLGGNGRRLLCGAVAGAFSRTAVAPLETIRTHMMVGKHAKSFQGVLHWIMENEGWTGLFRGNTINVIRVAPSKAIELFVFDKVKLALTPKEGEARPKIPVASIAGSAAGITSTILMYPLELLKTRLTIQSKEYSSISNAFMRIVQEEGFAELYRGLWPSVVGVIPYAGTNYFAYDYLRTLYKKTFKTDHIGNIETLLIGSAAGAIASSATFPLEVARKRMQVGALQGRLVYRNTLHCLACVLKEEGVGGLYRGLGPSCLKLVPAAGLSFMCYEALKTLLLEEENENKHENKEKEQGGS